MSPAASTASRRESLHWQQFDTPDALAQALSLAVAEDLVDAIDARGRALAALAGGRTPVRFLRALAARELPWDAVTITTSDERCVPLDDAQSNHRLLRELLLQGPASEATLVPLYDGGALRVAPGVADLPLPFDVLVLGMGHDGHVASLFPGGDALAAALDPAQTEHALLLRAEAAQVPRVTFTLAVLLAARRIYLHIEDERKRELLQRVLAGAPDTAALPVAQLLARARSPVHAYWSA